MTYPTRLRHAPLGTALVSLLLLGGVPSTASQLLALPEPQVDQPAPQASLFNRLQTLQVMPSGNYLGGGFVRINYVPGRGHFIVTFNAALAQPEGGCTGAGHAYKEYTADLQATGQAGVISCAAVADIGSLLIGDSYYLASMHREGQAVGWQLTKYNAVTWATQVNYFYPLAGYPREGDADMMLAYVNGQIDISSQYNDNPTGTPPDLMAGAATHHHFFTTDLQFLVERILSDTPHITGSSMIFVNGVYHFVTANAYLGDIVVMRYDQNWQYLGVKTLKAKGKFSEGLVFDGSRFYVAYTDTSQRGGPTSLPLYQNIRLAAFDPDWNLVEDLAVTSFTPQDYKQPDRPWLILQNNRLYVSYDQATVDPYTGQELPNGQAFVVAYDLAPTTCTSFTISPTSASPTAAAGSQQVTLTGSPAGCSGGSWTAAGNGSWLTVSPASGTGAGTVTASWTQNTSASPRTGNATIAGNTFAVNQSGTSGGTCTPGATTLCIANRFQVQVAWSTAQGGGQSGQGHAVSTSNIGFSLGGIFWFFDSTNPEMLIKVLNGCSSNSRYWFFASAGTNVGLSITVTDVQSGQTKTYTNPDLTAAQPIQDTNAFATCP